MIITLSEFRLYVNAQPDTALEDLHTDLIGGAQEAVEAYLGYPLEENTYTRYYDGTGQDFIYLDIKPVKEITSLYIDGEEYSVENLQIIGNQILSKDFIFSRGNKNITVVFTAGYPEGTVPKIIKTTVLRIAGILWTESNGNVGITSKTFEGNNRAFLNTRFDKYLEPLRKYKLTLA